MFILQSRLNEYKSNYRKIIHKSGNQLFLGEICLDNVHFNTHKTSLHMNRYKLRCRLNWTSILTNNKYWVKPYLFNHTSKFELVFRVYPKYALILPDVIRNGHFHLKILLQPLVVRPSLPKSICACRQLLRHHNE